MTQAITPSAAANLLEVDANLWLANTAVNIMYAVLFQDSTANALASSTAGTVAGANYAESASLHYTGVAMGVAATTFKIRAGGGAAGTTTFNGQNGVRQHGGVAASFLKVKEIMV